jgi:hypothetical protein
LPSSWSTSRNDWVRAAILSRNRPESARCAHQSNSRNRMCLQRGAGNQADLARPQKVSARVGAAWDWEVGSTRGLWAWERRQKGAGSN